MPIPDIRPVYESHWMPATENPGAHHWIGSHAQRLECKWLDFTTGCAWRTRNAYRD